MVVDFCRATTVESGAVPERKGEGRHSLLQRFESVRRLIQRPAYGLAWNAKCSWKVMNFRTTIPLIVLPVSVLIAVYHGKLPVEKQGQVAEPFHDIKVTPAMLDDALSGARTHHKLLMVEFGANWCGDCLALSQHLEQQETRDYFEKHFVLLKVDVGEFNRNLEMAALLGVDINQGIPTAVFFAPDGNRIGATNGGELGPSQKYGSNQILAFLKEVAEQRRITNPRQLSRWRGRVMEGSRILDAGPDDGLAPVA